MRKNWLDDCSQSVVWLTVVCSGEGWWWVVSLRVGLGGYFFIQMMVKYSIGCPEKMWMLHPWLHWRPNCMEPWEAWSGGLQPDSSRGLELGGLYCPFQPKPRNNNERWRGQWTRHYNDNKGELWFAECQGCLVPREPCKSLAKVEYSNLLRCK